jgi:hypothetical protein
MIYVTVGSLAFGVLGVAYAITCYYKLWQWARQCQHARIVVANKGRVRLNAPIVEWLLWCNMLDKDEGANGRMIYSVSGTSIAIIKKSFTTHRSPAREFAAWLLRRKMTEPSAPLTRAQAKQGKWSSQDETLVTGNKGEPT